LSPSRCSVETVEAAHLPSNARLVRDWSGNVVALFENEWSFKLAQEWNTSLAFAPFGAERIAVP